MDIAVAYGNYGMEVIRQRAPKANLQFIYHGVDTEVFHPLSSAEKEYARKVIIGVTPDKLVIGIVARNQPRKAFDKLFESYFYILNGAYVRCKSCEKITVFPYDVIKKEFYVVDSCKYCRSKDIVQGKPRDDIRLYVHGAVVDCGWDLLDLQTDFNLNGKVLVNPALRIGSGVSEHTLNSVYNSFDIFTLPTRGEGFGLPVLEAMSCGVPIVVTDYSAHPEWCKEGGILVPPVVLEAEPLTNIRRAIIDMDCYVDALLRLIDSAELREKYGAAGRKKAESFDWKIICSQWEKLIDGVLYPEGNAPDKIKATDLNYVLEEI
jgi:glycosyltransferase involved in cell wall biosynthesis